MGADVPRVVGVVVEPGQDLHVDPGGQPVMGEVRLPGLVGLLGLESQVPRLWSLGGIRDDLTVADQDPVDRGSRQPSLVMVVPTDGLRAGVVPGRDQFLA